MNITNNTPIQSGWAGGINSHGETLNTPNQYAGTLNDTMLVIEFATTSPITHPEEWLDPYDQGALPYLFAADEDALAWYSYSPGNPFGFTEGGYYVPSYDFGDIAAGDTIQRDLHFVFDEGGILNFDPRYSVLFNSHDYGLDILSNRTTSLKIGNWIGDIGFDYGNSAYDESNSSVFHNTIPEPATIFFAASGLLALLLRKKR